MKIAIVLDTGPLGLVTNPKATATTQAIALWLINLLQRNIAVYVPEIADYEVRRELLRGKKMQGLQRLDALKTALQYLPITTATMLQAAAFWAQARQQGTPTAADTALDGDVILAAQATQLKAQGLNVIVATTNVKHLSLFITAKLWHEIPDS